MSTTDPLTRIGTNVTPQSQAVPGRSDQVKNNAGGFVFEIDPLAQLRRFLTIGTTGGTYYVGEQDLTLENAENILALANGNMKSGAMGFQLSTPDESTFVEVSSHRLMVNEIVTISLAGRALKQNPTLFALAIACQHGTTEEKQYARQQITKVVRTGTHLFIFMRYLKQFGGINRGLRREIGKWYTERTSDDLAYQLVKYRQREGYTHRDVLRLVHPKVELPKEWAELHQKVLTEGIEAPPELVSMVAEFKTKRATLDWVVKGDKGEFIAPQPQMIQAFEAVQDPGNRDDIPLILETNKLPWEALPDEAMNDSKVWDKLLDNGMPINALVRQLPRLTNLGMLPAMGQGRTADVIGQLLNPEAVSKSRIHPFQVLLAMKTYASGHGTRNQWTPTAKIVDALDEMFYLSFGNVESTGKRTMLALDISQSMTWDRSAGRLPMTAMEITAAMAMVTVRSEPEHLVVAFSSGLTGLPISARQRLDDVQRMITGLYHGSTDCSLPMLEAINKNLQVDTFVVYTDNETWAGRIHPFQALKQYRKHSGIDAKLIVVATDGTRFTIADPSDRGMLDISGFDSAAPSLISEFSAGRI